MKLAGVVVIFIKYLSLVSKGGDIKEIWIWVIVVLIILYILGTEGKRRESEILTAAEAEDALEKEIERKRKKGQIDRWATIYIGPNNGLQHHEGLPQHYLIGVEIVSQKSREYKRGLVFAEGTTKGYVTIQDSNGKLTGQETIPIVSPLPKWLKRSKKYDLNLDKYLFGDQK